MSNNKQKFISDNMMQNSEEFPKIYDNFDIDSLAIILDSQPNLIYKRDDKTGLTLLFRAVLNGNYKVSEFLLDKNGEPNIQNVYGETPLHHAVEKANHKLINLLLEKGANPNIKQFDGETPMHIAALKGDYKVIKLLNLYGGDVNVRTKVGYFPIDYANERGNQKCVEILGELMEKQFPEISETDSNLNTIYRNDEYVGFQTAKNSDSPIHSLRNRIDMSPRYFTMNQNNTSKNSSNPYNYSELNSKYPFLYFDNSKNNMPPLNSNNHKTYSNNLLGSNHARQDNRMGINERNRSFKESEFYNNNPNEMNNNLRGLNKSELNTVQESTQLNIISNAMYQAETNFVQQMNKLFRNEFFNTAMGKIKNTNSNIEENSDNFHVKEYNNVHLNTSISNSNNKSFDNTTYDHSNRNYMNLDQFNNLNYANLINSHNIKKNEFTFKGNSWKDSSSSNQNEDSAIYAGNSQSGTLNEKIQNKYHFSPMKNVNENEDKNNLSLNMLDNRVITLRAGDDEYEEDNYFNGDDADDSRITKITNFKSITKNEEIYNLPRKKEYIQSSNHKSNSHKMSDPTKFYSDKINLTDTFDDFNKVLAVFLSTKNDIDENYLKCSPEAHNIFDNNMRKSSNIRDEKENTTTWKYEELFNFNLNEMNEFFNNTEEKIEEEEEEQEDNREHLNNFILENIDQSNSKKQNFSYPDNYNFNNKNNSTNNTSQFKKLMTKNSKITNNSQNSNNVKYFSKSSKLIKDEFKHISLDIQNITDLSITQKVPDTDRHIVSNETLDKMNINFDNFKREASLQIEFEFHSTEAIKEISKFLKLLDLEKYTSLFINHGFDDLQIIIDQMKSDMAITDQNLKEIGISVPGHRAKILLRLEEECKNFEFPLPPNVYYNIPDSLEFTNDDYINTDPSINSLNYWLSHIKMDQYTNNFINNGYHSLELLLMQMNSKNMLNEKILEEEIGINKIGYRVRILNKLRDDAKLYIAKLKNNCLKLNDNKETYHKSCKCVIY